MIAAHPDTDGLIEGYASVFGVADLANDIVMSGAFRDTLTRRGARGVRMLFQHDPARPVGRWLALAEDRHGLWVKGRLAVETQAGRDLFALVKTGALDGLSIGFRNLRGSPDPRGRVRRLEVVDLWEVSLVTFPLNPGARLRAV
jgi:HK97 family phage prohead protease